MDDVELSCVACDWSGPKDEAEWIDMSGFYDDSMCDGHEGSGMWKCPKCDGPCEELKCQ